MKIMLSKLLLAIFIIVSGYAFADQNSANLFFKEKIQTQQIATDKYNDSTRFISENLYVLSIESSQFFKIEKPDRFVFAYSISSDNKLMLNGWRAVGLWGHKYNTSPDLVLSPFHESKFKLEPNAKLGNIILQKKDVKKIRKYITNNSTDLILFKPEVVNNEISYKVFAEKKREKDTVGVLQINDKMYAPIGIEMNPSPPKNYNEAN